jgi:hypothetical protein
VIAVNEDRKDLAVPLEELDQYGQHVTAVFLLTNGDVLAAQDWYICDELGTYKVYSGGDKFHIDQHDVEHIATEHHIREVVLDA